MFGWFKKKRNGSPVKGMGIVNTGKGFRRPKQEVFQYETDVDIMFQDKVKGTFTLRFAAKNKRNVQSAITNHTKLVAREIRRIKY